MTKRKLLYILIKALFISFFSKRVDKRKLQNEFIFNEIEFKFDSYVTLEIGEWYIVALNLMNVRVEKDRGFVFDLESWPFQLSKIGERPLGDPITGEISVEVEK